MLELHSVFFRFHKKSKFFAEVHFFSRSGIIILVNLWNACDCVNHHRGVIRARSTNFYSVSPIIDHDHLTQVDFTFNELAPVDWVVRASEYWGFVHLEKIGDIWDINSNTKLHFMYEDDQGSEANQQYSQQNNSHTSKSNSQYSRDNHEKSVSSERGSRKDSEQTSEFEDREMQVRRWQWAYPIIEGVSPCQRGGHTATLSGASIVIFGGHYYTGKNEGYAYLNDTYVLDVNANKFTKPKISGTPPAPRYGHSAVLAGSKIIIFGGRGAKSKIFRDLHALDPVSMTWLQGPEGIGSPSARYGHTAVLVAETKIFIFGGTNGKEYYNDLYVLDLEVMAWSQPKCEGPLPSPRQGHTAIQVGTNMIIQGGFNFDEEAQRNSGFRQGTQLQSCYLNDIRILDTEKYEWARVRVSGTPPLPRYGHTANISGPDIIFFGGWSINSGARGEQNFIPPADIDYFIVLNTDNELVWEKGKFEGQPPLSRYGHTATSIGPHILIFGGWEFNRAASEVVVLRDMTAATKKK